jgi:hypothetical protein
MQVLGFQQSHVGQDKIANGKRDQVAWQQFVSG